ncbi:MAG TPA: CinA family nicotinamide mononucleotide deamidase-related protein [Pirellulales bacterium]|jgi:nicotinamide-nucleotide amidase|nr:CinA family nicotinamide mononucleotide deamidase-related protein [Pirellulales bacterium]
MQAEVISIGDELTSGQRLDTNSQWLSQQLGAIGIPVLYHTTVADDLPANVRVFQQAAQRAEIVVASGGLGPTADDLTREALAQASGRPLVLDEAALAHIRALFSVRKRPMPESNRVQAMFPEGSRVLANPHGSAPGIAMEIARPAGGAAHVFALPGVPAEMREMWQASVAPAIQALGGERRVIRFRRIKCFGVGESDLEQMLPDLIRRGREPQVGITVHDATITLRIVARGVDEAACQALIEPTEQVIRQSLGTLVFGEEDDELPQAVLKLLAQRKQTLATCEWGTGGLLADWLAAADPPGDRYLGGSIIRSAASLLAMVVDDLSPDVAAVDLASAMANYCRRQFGADWGLAVGPFPGDSEDQPPLSVHLALASSAGVKTASTLFTGHPAILRPRAGKQALNLARLALIRP